MTSRDPTSDSNELVIERVLQHSKRPAQGQSRAEPVAATSVFALLQREFSLAEIRRAIETCLRQTGDVTWADAVTTPRQDSATDACLRLARDVPALALTSEFVQELVYKINSIAGLSVLRQQIERHLSEVQLVDALTLGLHTATADRPRASCLAALGFYYPLLKKRSDTAALQRSLLAYEREVRPLRKRDKECLGCVKTARERLWGIRRARAELPKPSARSYIAYHQDLDPSAGYLIERRDDHELAITVTRLELDHRTLIIEYECFDPELLPENAPDVIELTLLQEYAQDTYLPLVDEAHFVDTRFKQTRSRRLSRAHRLI